ncbi:FecR family protein [Allosphingosinicella deserti]|uniref:Iron dicitrate transport regulator FecR n=1 Tax=Allosphingosinicella deserti TaxID=2116704 RepID=A0A2P7QVV3_9SPHN|nr:FecR domain-containing protein [Sphingomonas deserti]PSJ42098.1 iron dicitrate transport regulator FecR [Sphingomonas deserti]
MHWTFVDQAANPIDEAAAAWVARRGRGLGEEEEAALQAWLAADRRHVGALIRAEAVFATFDRARALGPLNVERLAPHPSRRWLLGAGGAAIAASFVGAAAVSLWPRDQLHEHATGTGEIRSIPLADGSVVTLDAASRLAVAFSGRERVIALLAGRALFDVAKDPDRPFTVDAGALSVRALGTSFSVERLGSDGADVLMREGLVEVTRRATRGSGTTLRGTDRLTFAAGKLMRRAPDAQSVERALGWRSGMLDFADVPLGDAVSTFARYGGTRIVVAPEVAGRRVTGLFAASDPRGFALAAAASLGIRAESAPNQIVLTR